MKYLAALLIPLFLIGCATQDQTSETRAPEKVSTTMCWDGSQAPTIALCPPPLDGCLMCPDTTCLDSVTNDPKDAGICTPMPPPAAQSISEIPRRPEQTICPDGRVVNWAGQCRSVEDTRLENGMAACGELGLTFDPQTNSCA